MRTTTCHRCGCEHPIDDLQSFDGQLYCEECLDEITILCTECGERIYRSENHGSDELPLCESCLDEYYAYCTRCGCLIRSGETFYPDEDEDNPYCAHCYEEVCSRPIKNYNYKPTPIFYGHTQRYMGVELEIDQGGENDDNAREILDIANVHNELIYCKHDGSLDDGFEIVTHPMSLDFHLHTMPWKEILREARAMDYVSHQAGTCGLHIHVSRKAFSEDRYAQDRVIARILYFMERNWNELLRFSRRTERQLQRWAARYGYKDQPREMLEHVKNHDAGRYACLNLTNTDTIEFRIFRGTLKLNTLIATLQLVNRICDVALSMSDDEIRKFTWNSFVESVTEPELIQYLKERRLYISEPVESEEEI